MKKLLLVLFLILMSACSSFEGSLETRLDSLFEDSTLRNASANNVLPYFSYYLPSDMVEESYDETGAVLSFNGATIYMNLNIASLINSRYYGNYYLSDDSLMDEERLIYRKNGKYGDLDYIYCLYEYEECYLLHFVNNRLNFYVRCGKEDVLGISRDLLLISQSVEVDRDQIVAAFSNKDTIDYEKKQLDLFDASMPANGELSSLLTGDALIGDGQYQSEESSGEVETFDEETNR